MGSHDGGSPESSGSNPSTEDVPTSMWAGQGKYFGYGLTWAMATLLFFFLGLWLDGKLGTTPWLTIGGAFFGGGTGFYNLYAHLILEPQHRSDRKRPRGDEAVEEEG